MFVQSWIDALMVSAIFNPNIVYFWEQVLDNKHVLVLENLLRSNSESVFSASSLDDVSLNSSPVPANFIGKSFGELFLSMLDSDPILLVIGLYRRYRCNMRTEEAKVENLEKQDSWSKTHSYAYLAPRSADQLHESDFMFTLSSRGDSKL